MWGIRQEEWIAAVHPLALGRQNGERRRAEAPQ